jgi:hypothetical protein
MCLATALSWMLAFPSFQSGEVTKGLMVLVYGI